MEALLQYLIKSTAVLALFFICFKTLLCNETFFTTKRVYLLVGVLSCLLLPFVVITNYLSIDPVPLDWKFFLLFLKHHKQQTFQPEIRDYYLYRPIV